MASAPPRSPCSFPCALLRRGWDLRAPLGEGSGRDARDGRVWTSGDRTCVRAGQDRTGRRSREERGGCRCDQDCAGRAERLHGAEAREARVRIPHGRPRRIRGRRQRYVRTGVARRVDVYQYQDVLRWISGARSRSGGTCEWGRKPVRFSSASARPRDYVSPSAPGAPVGCAVEARLAASQWQVVRVTAFICVWQEPSMPASYATTVPEPHP
ncbi:hypothetical protein B0H21DRAFT_252149 [Amylocystis lapponica]|nr:hypothetical protein B0H21DRAFT_252149 [Amylocystis lapponica]